jgi:uncharacterized protein YbjT (DUF2867 family)
MSAPQGIQDDDRDPAAGSTQHSPLRGDRVLVTGASGFIGRHLHSPLAAAGFEVRCLTRAPEEARRRWPDRTWVGGDVGDPASLASALRGCTAA